MAEEIVRQVNRHAEVVLRASHAATTAAAASTGGGGASTSAAAAAAGAGPSTSAAAGRGAPPGAPLSPSSGPLKRGRRLNVVDVEPDEGQLAELRRAQGQVNPCLDHQWLEGREEEQESPQAP